LKVFYQNETNDNNPFKGMWVIEHQGMCRIYKWFSYDPKFWNDWRAGKMWVSSLISFTSSAAQSATEEASTVATEEETKLLIKAVFKAEDFRSSLGNEL
jgi:hypothetical protein